jgi:hypothetical protein
MSNEVTPGSGTRPRRSRLQLWWGQPETYPEPIFEVRSSADGTWCYRVELIGPGEQRNYDEGHGYETFEAAWQAADEAGELGWPR